MPRSGIAGSYDNFIFSFLRNLHTVSIVVASIYIPTNSVGGFLFSTPSPAFVICRLFNDGHFDLLRWHLIVALICISLVISDVEHLFMCLLDICVSSLGPGLLIPQHPLNGTGCLQEEGHFLELGHYLKPRQTWEGTVL